MPKRKQTKYIEPAPRIEKLDNVPGPEASADVLKAHYRRVQDIIATHRYDDVLYMCHWCCDGEAELAFTKTDQPRGTRMYCTARCANAYAAYMQKVVVKGRTVAPSASDETEDDSYDAPPGAAQPTKTRRRRNAGVVTKAYTAIQPGSDEELAALESASKPLPAGTKIESTGTVKARKPRAKKEERADGKCAKGLHDMTAENLYEYNGNVWCRECRKASRAKSVEKRNGA